MRWASVHPLQKKSDEVSPRESNSATALNSGGRNEAAAWICRSRIAWRASANYKFKIFHKISKKTGNFLY